MLLAGDPPIAGASVTIEQVVFTPDHFEKLLIAHKLPLDYRDNGVVAETRQEASALLVAALGGWLDFFFVPEPKRFILYADHDEYTTLYAPRKGALSAIGGALIKAGFKEDPDYVRGF